MTKTIIKKEIEAPVERVFQTIADIKKFSRAVDDINLDYS
jgi:hypothetical protein